MRSRVISLGLLALLAGGCTVVGHGKSAKPAWKTYVDEHPVSSAPLTLRSGAVEVRVEAVVVEEHHTAFGKSSWLNVAKASVVNLGSGPLRWTELSDGFRIRTRSGADLRGYVFKVGKAGWRRQEDPKEPELLPPGAVGQIRVQAEPGQGSARDDPAAISFRGRTVELR